MKLFVVVAFVINLVVKLMEINLEVRLIKVNNIGGNSAIIIIVFNNVFPNFIGKMFEAIDAFASDI